MNEKPTIWKVFTEIIKLVVDLVDIITRPTALMLIMMVVLVLFAEAG